MFAITLSEAVDAPQIQEQQTPQIQPIYEEPVIENKDEKQPDAEPLNLPEEILLSLFERTERGVHFTEESNIEQYFSTELNKEFPLHIKQEKGNSVVSFEQIVKSSDDVLKKLMEEQSFLELAYDERRARFLQKMKEERQKKVEAAAKSSPSILNIISNKKKKRQQQQKAEKETKLLTKVTNNKTLKVQSHTLTMKGTPRLVIEFNYTIGEMEWKYPHPLPDNFDAPTIAPPLPGESAWSLLKDNQLQLLGNFQPSSRYSVTVPGTTSSNISLVAPLGAAVTFEVESTPFQVLATFPDKNDFLLPQQIFYMAFNCAIDHQFVLNNLVCKCKKEYFDIELATVEEYETAHHLRCKTEPKRKPEQELFFRPSKKLPTNAKVSISLKPGHVYSKFGNIPAKQELLLWETSIAASLSISFTPSSHGFTIYASYPLASNKELDEAIVIVSSSLQIFPKIEFVCNRERCSTGTFVFDAEWKPSTCYSISVPKLNSIYDIPSRGTTKFNYLNSMKLLVTPFRSGSGEYGVEPEFLFSFNENVDHQSFLGYVRLTQIKRFGRTSVIPLRLKHEITAYYNQVRANALDLDKSVCIEPVNKLEYSTEYRLELSRGFRSLDGPEPCNEVYYQDFTTVSEPFTARVEDKSIVFSDRLQATNVTITTIPRINKEIFHVGTGYSRNFSNSFSRVDLDFPEFLPNVAYVLDLGCLYSNKCEKLTLENNEPLVYVRTVNQVENIVALTEPNTHNQIGAFTQFLITLSYAVTYDDIAEQIFLSNNHTVHQVVGDEVHPQLRKRAQANKCNIYVEVDEAFDYNSEFFIGLYSVPCPPGTVLGDLFQLNFQVGPPLEIVKFPETVHASEKEGETPFWVEFNQAVYLSSFESRMFTTEDQENNKKLVKLIEEFAPVFDPPMDGYWTSDSSKLIRFITTDPFSEATKYKLTFKAGFSALCGTCFIADKVIEFESSRPNVVLHFPVNSKDLLPLKPMFLFKCNTTIIPEQILSLCELRMNATPQQASRTLAVANDFDIEQFPSIRRLVDTFKNEPNARDKWAVIIDHSDYNPGDSGKFYLKRGIRSQGGNLESSNDIEISFKLLSYFTYLHLDPPTIVNTRESSVIPISNALALNFSEELSLDQAVWPTITPATDGHWEINGFKLEYHPEDNWKKSTNYTIKIPKEIKSASNLEMRKSVTVQLHTGTPVPKVIYPPSGSISGNQLFLIRFDQAVDVDSVISKCHFVSRYAKLLKTQTACRLATEEEIEQLPDNVQRINDPLVEFYLVPNKQLPPSTKYQFTIASGIKPLEGKLNSKSDYSFQYKTKEPFEIVDAYISNPYVAGKPLVINFNSVIGKFDVNISHDELFRISIKRVFARKATFFIQLLPGAFVNEDIDVRVDLSRVMDERNQVLSTRDSYMDIRVHCKPFICGLRSFYQQITVLRNPLMEPIDSSYSLRVLNYKEIRVLLYKLTTSDIPKWVALEPEDSVSPSTKKYGNSKNKLYDQVHRLEIALDQELIYTFDIFNLLTQNQIQSAGGQIGVVIVPTMDAHFPNGGQYPLVRTWLQFTTIGLDVFGDIQSMYVWSTDLKNKEGPLSGVKLSLLQLDNGKESNQKVESDPYGLATFTNLSWTSSYALTATNPKTNEVAVLFPLARKKEIKIERDKFLLHSFTDRGCYNPGEYVTIKGYIRHSSIPDGQSFEKLVLPTNIKEFSYSIKDQLNNQFVEKKVITLNAFASFDFRFTIPKNNSINLGLADVEYQIATTDGRTIVFHHHFQIQEFKPPQFKVEAKLQSPEPLYFSTLASEPIIVKGVANYYSGGYLDAAQAKWRVQTTYLSNTNDHILFRNTSNPWIDYRFGTIGNTNDPLALATFENVLDDCSESLLEIKCSGAPKLPIPLLFESSIEVIDQSNETQSSNLSFLVYPAAFSVGIKCSQFPSYTWNDPIRGQPLDKEKFTIEFIVLDNQTCQLKETDCVIKVIYNDFSSNKLNEQKIKLKSSAGQAISQEINITSLQVGSIEVVITASDSGTKASSVFKLLVPPVKQNYAQLAENKAKHKPVKSKVGGIEQYIEDSESISLKLAQTSLKDEKDRFLVDTNGVIDIYVRNEEKISIGLVVFYCNGIYSIRCLSSAERIADNLFKSSAIIYIEEPFYPNLIMETLLVSQRPYVRSGAPIPMVYNGKFPLNISDRHKLLRVELETDKEIVAPGANCLVSVTVRDYEKRAIANSEVALIVVDESILDMIKYSLDVSLLQSMYPRRTIENQIVSLGRFTNRKYLEILSKEEVQNIDTVGDPIEYYDYPGSTTRHMSPVSFKDKKFKNYTGSTGGGHRFLEILDTAGTEQLYVVFFQFTSLPFLPLSCSPALSTPYFPASLRFQMQFPFLDPPLPSFSSISSPFPFYVQSPFFFFLCIFYPFPSFFPSTIFHQLTIH